MKSKGNGTPQQCIANLLLITRGEVPYDRVKGIDATLVDRPSTQSGPMLVADARWLIETYEPRVDVQSAQVRDQLAQSGLFALCGEITGAQ